MADWRDQLSGAFQGEWAAFLLDVSAPLHLIGAQVLWVAQPSLSLFIDQARIRAWAELLEDPARLAALREAWGMEKQAHD